jgi:hypothetical protein
MGHSSDGGGDHEGNKKIGGPYSQYCFMRSKVKRIIFIALGVLLLWSCTSTFNIQKEGKTYFFGSREEGFYKMMCESGDLSKILEATSLPKETKESLYKWNCSPERSVEMVKKTYVSLTPEQRKDLRLAFKKYGYEVNAMRC